MPEIDERRERRRHRERRQLWKTIGLWVVAAFAAWLVAGAAERGGLYNFAGTVTFMLVLAFGYTDRAIRDLWRHKADKRFEDIDDE